MTQYQLIKCPEDFQRMLPALLNAAVIGVDTETTGLDPHSASLRLIQLAIPGYPVLILDCLELDPEMNPLLERVFASSAVKVFQNAKFDIQFLMTINISVLLPIFDTMLSAQLLRSSGGPDRVALDVLARHYLGVTLTKEEQASDWSGHLSESQLKYAARDAQILLELRDKMVPILVEEDLIEVARLEFACVRGIAQMEYAGIYLDRSCWQRLRLVIESNRQAALEKIYQFTGRPAAQQTLWGDSEPIQINPDSSQQVMAWLREQGILVENTSKHTLSAYAANPLVAAILEYRQAAKGLSSFLNPFADMIHAKTARLHPRYSQMGAWSGRMSCGQPNIQQIPREAAYRACFQAPPGRKLVIADYSQIELRVAAELAQDQRMIAAYQNHEDLHKLTASLMTGTPSHQVTPAQRQAAKAVNFGLIYAMGARGLMEYARETYGIHMTLGEASLFRNRFFEAYTGIDQWHRRMKAHLPKETRTLAGRKHVYNETAGLASVCNTPVQGGAADILKQAIGQLVDTLVSLDAYMVAVVHDEIILEVSENDAEAAARILKQVMEDAGRRYLKHVPTVAEVHIGQHWGEK